MEKQVQRKFKMADHIMMKEAVSFQSLYESDKADFEAYNNVIFHAGFGAGFLALIDSARSFVKDNVVMYTQAQETAEFCAKHKECCKFFQLIKPEIKHIFCDKAAILNQFGFNDYQTASKIKWKMINFMDVLFETATHYSAELIAGGFAAAKIARIETLAHELKAEQLDKDEKKKGRPVTTSERITLYNEVWDVMLVINSASKAVYMGNYAKLKQYELPHKRKTAAPKQSSKII
jgi:hypothetical protein